MKIAYDVKLDRPGCAIVQAALGCEGKVCAPFDSDAWLTVPTPDMAVYEATPEQISALARRVNSALQEGHRR